MRLLVIGGTIFVGRHFVEAAMERGHEVTLLHRGKRGGELFPSVDRILADRDGDLSELGDRQWDAVVDCCGYVPRIVQKSVQALANKASRYLFVSTISVYKNPELFDMDESAEVGTLEDPTVEEITGETYGPLKVLCEEEVSKVYGDQALIVRPGLIMGPYDPSNRFTYWVDRFAKGGKVLVPARREQPLQLIDARDLGAWMLHCLEAGVTGTYNAAGPATPQTFGAMIDVCHGLNPEAEIVYQTEDEIKARGIALWQELPLAQPIDPPADGFLRVSNRKAVEAGLVFRSWSETASDTLAWVQGPEPKPNSNYGLPPEKEEAALRA